MYHITFSSQLDNRDQLEEGDEGGVCPSERFLDPTLQLPPPINFEHDQISFYLALFRVRLGYDTFWAERSG